MTLILELPEDLEARLRTAAEERGLNEADAVRFLLDRTLPPAESPRQTKSAFGKYAGAGPTVDEFLREKHAETAREEASWSNDDRAA